MVVPIPANLYQLASGRISSGNRSVATNCLEPICVEGGKISFGIFEDACSGQTRKFRFVFLRGGGQSHRSIYDRFERIVIEQKKPDTSGVF